MSVEITYTSSGYHVYNNVDYRFDRQHYRDTVYINLEWMTNLTSLELIKFGEHATFYHPLMLDDLLSWLFSAERAPRALQHLWSDGFELSDACRHYSAPPSLLSYHTTKYPGDNAVHNQAQPFSRFPLLEYVAYLRFSEQCCKLYLPNLKFAHGRCGFQDEPVRNKILPNLN